MTATDSETSPQPSPRGFAGWLLLLALGQVLAPLCIASAIFDDISIYRTDDAESVPGAWRRNRR